MKNKNKTIAFASLASVMLLSLGGMSMASAGMVDTSVSAEKIEVYETCEERVIFGIPTVLEYRDIMSVSAQYWEQSKNKPDFKLKYNFPETISRQVIVHGTDNPIGLGCEVHKKLIEINIVSQSENQDSENIYNCFNRGFVSGDNGITADNPLTDTLDGFPSTDGYYVDLKCEKNNYASNVGDDQHIGIRAIYENLDNGETKTYQLDAYGEIPPSYP